MRDITGLRMLVVSSDDDITNDVSYILQKNGFQTLNCDLMVSCRSEAGRFGFDGIVLLRSAEPGESDLEQCWRNEFPSVPFFSWVRETANVCGPAEQELMKGVISVLFPVSQTSRRQTKRVGFSQSIDWALDSKNYHEGRIKNISEAGILVETGDGFSPSVGDLVRVEFYFESFEGISLFEGLGVVRWTSGSAEIGTHIHGVQFVKLNQPSKHFINQIITGVREIRGDCIDEAA